MLNIAVIGGGKVACYGHLPAIAQSESWHLRAIVDRDERQLAEAASRFEPDAALRSLDELWRLGDLDAVVVATHLGSHHEIVLAALAHGVHVLCEKPMAAELAHCHEMVAAAEQAGRLLAVNFNTRSQLAYRMIRQEVEAGTLGSIRVARFVYNWSVHQWTPLERLENFMANGGPIIDSGVHFFDGVRLFTGQSFAAIDAQGIILPPYEHPQHVIASCRLDGGAIALVEAGWLYTKRTKEADAIYRVELIGDDGALTADLIQSTLLMHDQEGCRRRTIDQKDKGFGWIYERLAASIAQGRLIDLASGKEGCQATQAAFAALAATRDQSSASLGS